MYHFQPYIPRSRGHSYSSISLAHSMLLPIHNDSKYALLHLKGLALAEMNVQRRAGPTLTNALVAQIMRFAHGAEARRIRNEVVQDRTLGRSDGGVVRCGRALQWAGRQPLLEAGWWHFWGLLLWPVSNKIWG